MLRGSAGSAGDFLHVIRDGRFVSAVQVALNQDIDHSGLLTINTNLLETITVDLLLLLLLLLLLDIFILADLLVAAAV